MSLLNKASIITTPTAYAEDYLYSIKPAIPYGDELIVNGNFNTDSDWTLGTYSTISDNKVVISNSTGELSLSQNINVSQKTLKITYTISDYSSGVLRTQYGAVNGTNRSANGTYTDIITGSNTTTTINFFSLTSSTSLSISNVSVKEVTDADFDFDRNSTGTRLNEDYLIEDVPYNFVTYSEDFSQSSWQKEGGATIESNVDISPSLSRNASYLKAPVTTNATVRITYTFSSAASQTYVGSIFVKKENVDYIRMLSTGATSSTLQAYYNVSNGTLGTSGTPAKATIEPYGNGWYRLGLIIDAVNTTSSASFRIQLAKSDGAGIDDFDGTEKNLIWGAQLVKGDQPKDYLKTTDRLDIPRIDYTNGEPSILLEPSRSNLVTYSQDFTQWGNARTTDTANQITSPDGLNNGTLLEQQSGQTNAGSIFFNVSLSSGTYTQSIYAKKKDKNFIVGYDANAARTYFNLETGKVGTVASGVTAEMIAMPNDWYRCIITYTITTGAVIAFYLADNDNSSTVTDSGGVYIYGAQVEAGSYPTSLIHTSGSTVTRSADLANNAGNSDLINSTEGVLYCEIAALADDGTNRTIALNKDTNDRIQLYFNTSTNGLSVFYKAQGTTTFIMNETLSDATEFNKVAFKWKANDFALWVNGTETNTVSSGVTSNADTLNALEFEMFNNSSTYYGKTKMVAVFKEALTDTELACLTGYNSRELYLNYFNRLSFIGVTEEYNVESDINNYIL